MAHTKQQQEIDKRLTELGAHLIPRHADKVKTWHTIPKEPYECAIVFNDEKDFRMNTSLLRLIEKELGIPTYLISADHETNIMTAHIPAVIKNSSLNEKTRNQIDADANSIRDYLNELIMNSKRAKPQEIKLDHVNLAFSLHTAKDDIMLISDFIPETMVLSGKDGKLDAADTRFYAMSACYYRMHEIGMGDDAEKIFGKQKKSMLQFFDDAQTERKTKFQKPFEADTQEAST